MTYLRIIAAEIVRDIKESLSYRVGIISDVAVLSILILSLLFWGTGSSLTRYYGNTVNSKTLLIIGYLFWAFSINAINVTSTEIGNEALKGTLEQKFMAVVPIGYLLFGKMVGGLIISSIVICLISVIVIILAHIPIMLTGFSVLVLMINLVGMYGMGLIFGSIALKYKKIGQLTLIVQILLIFMTDTLTNTFLSQGIGKIIPLTYGIDLARRSVSRLTIQAIDLVLLIIISCIWVLIGSVIFNRACQNVRKNGTLIFY